MRSGVSLGAAGGKRSKTVDCGTPYKRSMSSSRRPLVEMMMTMITTIHIAPDSVSLPCVIGPRIKNIQKPCTRLILKHQKPLNFSVS
ncbi:jg14547 [Pararge aegeria aegeria]|uniref:Jg14547 protein n=1 Tax=Pararge aegeria aegeria TaxID=348720 RepID=A0A8S4RE82_9NEOP|nr:jg14547 [Pararge aegeria aegeria]